MSNNKIKIEVYSASSFSDLMSSPAFYSTATIALVLGLSSIFGFLQSPDKLKNTVDTITQKVMVHQTEEAGRQFLAVDDVAEIEKATVSGLEKQTLTDRNSNSRYGVFSEKLPHRLSNDPLLKVKKPVFKGIQTIKLASFNYDITSKYFWSDFDFDSKLDRNLESGIKINDTLIGVPVEPDLVPISGDSKYSLKLDRNYQI